MVFMPIDDALATEALNLADGADIHDVVGLTGDVPESCTRRAN
jgi:hypothetical protein